MPRDQHRAYESLLAPIYDAALVESGWDRLVETLVAAVGGRGGTILFQDRSGLAPATDLMTVTGFPDDAPARYDAHFAAKDDRLGLVLAAPTGQVMADQWHLDHAAYLKTAMFNDFYRPAGLECGLGVNLFKDGGRVAVFSAFRELQRGACDADEIALIERLAPHLTRALQLKRQLDRATMVARGLASGLDRFGTAVLLLDPAGTLLELNAAADTLLSAPGCPLVLRGTHLTAPAPNDAPLAQTLARARLASTGAPPPVLTLTSRDGLLKLALMAVPVHRADRLGLGSPGGTLVFVTPSTIHGPIDPTTLARQFSLSASEAQVAAALAMGDSITAIADERRVSRETVRVQVKTVLAKTGLNSQGKLVALVTRSLAALRRP